MPNAHNDQDLSVEHNAYHVYRGCWLEALFGKLCMKMIETRDQKKANKGY